MKILFTGSTSKQTDDEAYKRSRVKRIDDSSIICNSLRKQGYRVDRRKVEWGEDLSEYGLAIVGIGQFGSNNYSGDVFNAIYALHECKNVIVFHEDWKIDGTMKSWSKALADGELDKMISKKWSDGKMFYGGVDSPLFDKSIAFNTILNVTNGKYPALIPAFDWGNKQIVREIIFSSRIFNLDLTPYVLENWNIPLVATTDKKKHKHMLASLVNHKPWVKRRKLEWDVDYFGAKSIKEAQQLRTETDVFEKCGEYWSILCPEYPHAGSGWFRIRWIYAAIQKSVLISSDKDLEALGLPLTNIEHLKDVKLKEYADMQSEVILKHMWTKQQFDKRLKDMVDEISNNTLIQTEYIRTEMKQSSLF